MAKMEQNGVLKQFLRKLLDNFARDQSAAKMKSFHLVGNCRVVRNKILRSFRLSNKLFQIVKKLVPYPIQVNYNVYTYIYNTKKISKKKE